MLVSVITPTYNRGRFIPRLIEVYKQQDYDHDLMEWLVFDDGTEPVKDLFIDLCKETLHYTHSETRLPMGEKLNYLAKQATGDIIVVMDDDDYYPPNRISSLVKAMSAQPNILLAGSSKVFMYSTEDKKIYCAGPYHDKHALNCTLAFRPTYLKDHAYDDNEVCAVERVFLNEFTEPMIQMEGQILHMIHSSNTYKNKMGISLMETTDLTLEHFIKDPVLRNSFLVS
jgi:glycosyltransferase involved in cell wall biosynthesis